MPKPNAGETRDEYMGRCMVYGDLQKYDEKQRQAICEHLFDREATPPSEEHKEGVIPADDPKFMHFEGMELSVKQIDREQGYCGTSMSLDRPASTATATAWTLSGLPRRSSRACGSASITTTATTR